MDLSLFDFKRDIVVRYNARKDFGYIS